MLQSTMLALLLLRLAVALPRWLSGPRLNTPKFADFIPAAASGVETVNPSFKSSRTAPRGSACGA